MNKDFTDAITYHSKRIADSIDKLTMWQITKAGCEGWYECNVSWISRKRTEEWNEICAWVVEQFGLPGDRYKMHADINEMQFLFRDAKDYEWMILRWG